MSNITYPHAVKYKGRYYAAGEQIKNGSGDTPVAVQADNDQPKPTRRRTAKKQAEPEAQDE